MSDRALARKSTYCLRCKHSLKGASANTCPECGTPFDDSDPSTFTRTAQPKPASATSPEPRGPEGAG